MVDPLGSAEVPDVDDMTPAEVHDVWEQETNLDAPELREVRNDPRNDAYLNQASDGREESDGPVPGGPLEDAQHLAETPRDQWTPDEKAEAEEGLNYKARTLPQYGADEGEPLLPERPPDFHTGEWAMVRWAMAPEEDDAEQVLK
jgi:hypothetical protein